MKTRIIFKRIEIWLLYAVMIGLLVYAFKPGDEVMDPVIDNLVVLSDESGSFAPEVTEEPEKEILVVEKVDVRPAQQGQIVEVTLVGRTPEGGEARLDESTVTATTGSGIPVGFFFEPFRLVGSLDGEEDSLATVKLWLEEPAEVVLLEFQGKTLRAELPE